MAKRYLGIEFQMNGKTHFGWARLNFKFVRVALRLPSFDAHQTEKWGRSLGAAMA